MPSSLNGTGVTFNDGTIQNTAAVSGDYIMRVYTSPDVWTNPANLKAIKVTVIGGGGGGGGARSSPSPNPDAPAVSRNGFHGGGGGFSMEYLDAPTIPGPVSVTVGSGGTAGPSPATLGVSSAGGSGGGSSFGPFLSATGGGGASTTAPGAGGAGSGGQVNIPGGRSGNSGRTGPAAVTPMSQPSQYAPGAGAGVAGNVYGGGATGAFSAGDGALTPFGGAVGGAGIVIVEEFY